LPLAFRKFAHSMKPYIALTKPRITWLILMSTAIGFVFGAKSWHWL